MSKIVYILLLCVIVVSGFPHSAETGPNRDVEQFDEWTDERTTGEPIRLIIRALNHLIETDQKTLDIIQRIIQHQKRFGIEFIQLLIIMSLLNALCGILGICILLRIISRKIKSSQKSSSKPSDTVVEEHNL